MHAREEAKKDMNKIRQVGKARWNPRHPHSAAALPPQHFLNFFPLPHVHGSFGFVLDAWEAAEHEGGVTGVRG